jgi:hypothetical protein
VKGHSAEGNSSSAGQQISRLLGNETLLMLSQEPVTGPYPEQDESNLQPHIPFLIVPILF